MCSTIRIIIIAGTCINGRLCLRDLTFSFTNLMLCSINPQCCAAAAQSIDGVVGRVVIWSLIDANSWSPLITTILKPRRRYILYIRCRASHIIFLLWVVRWVIVVKHILVLNVVKKMCLLMKNTSIANSTFWWSLINSVGTLTMLCVIRVAFFFTVFPFIFNTDRPQIASAAFALSVVTSHPGIPPVLTIAQNSAVDG